MENGGAEKAELRMEGQGCFLASLFVAFAIGRKEGRGKRGRLLGFLARAAFLVLTFAR